MIPGFARPRVLLSVFTSFDFGGAQVRFAMIANHFGKRFRHTLVSMNGSFACRERLDPCLDVTFIAVENKKGSTFANRSAFRNILQSVQPDRLITHNWGTIEWAVANWPSPVPHLHIEDGFGPEEALRQLRRRVMFRRLVLGRSTLVVPSRSLEQIALAEWKLPLKNVHYIPNGIDCARFAEPTIRQLVADSEIPLIGTVAVLRAEKNLSRLLEAFRLVRERHCCRLAIVGDGPERHRLEQRAAELGIAQDVLFLGYQKEVERVFASLDVCALSSDTEQMPLCVVEAMAAGLPVASTDVGDIASMVAPNNRPFIVACNAADLAQAILTLLENGALRQEIGKANRVVAQRSYSQAQMFERYAELI